MEGAAKEGWASHQVTTATLALEVALGVPLAHVGKQNVESTTRVSQCLGAPTPSTHHFRLPMAEQAVSVSAQLLPAGRLGGGWPMVSVRACLKRS